MREMGVGSDRKGSARDGERMIQAKALKQELKNLSLGTESPGSVGLKAGGRAAQYKHRSEARQRPDL